MTRSAALSACHASLELPKRPLISTSIAGVSEICQKAAGRTQDGWHHSRGLFGGMASSGTRGALLTQSTSSATALAIPIVADCHQLIYEPLNVKTCIAGADHTTTAPSQDA